MSGRPGRGPWLVRPNSEAGSFAVAGKHKKVGWRVMVQQGFKWWRSETAFTGLDLLVWHVVWVLVACGLMGQLFS